MIKTAALVMVVPALGILAVLWFQHAQSVTLPAPTGPYAVGRADYDWVDQSRVDPVAPAPRPLRELTVWVWYPAAPTAQAANAGYEPPPLCAALEKHMGRIMATLLTHDLSRVRCHALRGVPLSPAQPHYPVVVFKPGIGALALDYTTIAENLASHGYVVAASDSPYSTAVVVYRDGRVVTRTTAGHPTEAQISTAERDQLLADLLHVWAGDERFLLDRLAVEPQFAGRLNLQSVGAFGHSFGGAAAFEFCTEDARCKAGVDLDGRLIGDELRPNALTKPFLFILSDHTGEAESGAILHELQSATAALPNRPALLTIAGSRHFNFSDLALTKNTRVARLFGMLGPIDERQMLTSAADRTRAFFDAYLPR